MPMNPQQLKAFAKKGKPKAATPPSKPGMPPAKKPPAPGEPPIPPDDLEAAPPEQPTGEEPPPDEMAETDGVENTGETAGDGDVSNDEQIAQDVLAKVADGDIDEELVELVTSSEAIEGSFPWVQEPELWDRAQKALDPDDVPQGVDPFVALAHLYMALGGHVEGLSDQEAEEPGGEGHPEPDEDAADDAVGKV